MLTAVINAYKTIKVLYALENSFHKLFSAFIIEPLISTYFFPEALTVLRKCCISGYKRFATSRVANFISLDLPARVRYFVSLNLSNRPSIPKSTVYLIGKVVS